MAFVSLGRSAVRSCAVCKVDVIRFESQFSKISYCSRGCYSASRRGLPAHNKGKKITVTRECQFCNTAMIGAPHLMRRRKFCSQKCFGAYFSGDRAPSWNGGHSKDGRREFGSQGYKNWKLSVLSRDGGKCRWCDSEDVRTYHDLEIHHIIPFSLFPDGALDINNGITLCKAHHALTKGREDIYAERLAKIIGESLRTEPVTSNPSKKPLIVTAESLRDMYWGQGLSTYRMGVKMGVTGACIIKHMKKFGISREVNRRGSAHAS